MDTYNHWVIEQDEQHIIWLGFDRSDSSVNSINNAVLDELNAVIQSLEQQTAIKGLILYAAKEKGFVAGADVKSFSQFKQAEEAVAFLQKGQMVFSRLEALSVPTLAMIDGFCMGGGLELALACTYRIGTDEAHTRLGLPEVLLGIHPGWGGTVRLPQLMGGFQALTQMILTGRTLSARQAKKLGVLDEVVPSRQLKRAARHFIETKPPKRQPSFWQSLTNQLWLRALLAPLVRFNVAKKVKKAHYPAPFAMIELWEKENGTGARAYEREVESVKHLFSETPTAANLIRAFLLRERMKSFAKEASFKANHVHVIGAGTMGGDIAAWCAFKGIRVTLQDQSLEKIAPAMARAHKLFSKKLKAKHLVQAAMDRLIADVDGHGISRADVIIEAVFEKLSIKQPLIKQIEQKAQSHAIIATNTSSIPLEQISEVMDNPKRLVGIHYFNPVAQMELVEVVSSDNTATEVKEKACSFVGQISKLPLPVKSSPGFLVNRVLMPYLMECMMLVDEGVSKESIDKAACDFGMFMGPVELADTVGIDVCLAVAENLTQYYGGSIPEALRAQVASGKLGRKSGEGFYKYKNGKPIKSKVDTEKTHQDIAARLIFRMINESGACLREGVVADGDLLDGAMIFATGFAPFRGGPIAYAKSLGESLKTKAQALEQAHGARFKLDEYFNH